MIFLGTFLGGDELSVPITPTDVSNITRTTLKDGVYDELYITKDVTKEMTATPPKEWDFNTILYAEFDNSTMAGNLTVQIGSITHLVVKRKRTDEFKWITIDVKEILHDPDMTFEELVAQMVMKGVDYTATIGYEYEYAVVPMLNGIESIYSTAREKCESDGIVILDNGEVYMTTLTDGNIDTTAVVPNSPQESMWDKYPTIIRNTEANYETITVGATFVPGYEDCDTQWDDEVVMMEYSRKVYDFLRNDKPKLLKATDGRIWLTYVTTPPTDAYDDSSGMRNITFGLTEIGSVNSEEDLYDAGLINAGEEWWN